MKARLSLLTRGELLGGGTGGNEQLTAMTGVLLVILLAALGVTIVQIRQLIWLHLFLGFVLVGPVALKLVSTGYRFARYYTGNPPYVGKGPPEMIMRSIAPVVALSTVVVFASGIWLLFAGPVDRSTPLLIHKVSFIAWLAVTALHILGHLPAMGDSLKAGTSSATTLGSTVASGRAGRWIALSGAVVAGALLGLVLISHFSVWTAAGAFPHHGEH